MPNRGQRSTARRSYDLDVRVAWLEGDADQFELAAEKLAVDLHKLAEEMVARIERSDEKCAQRVEKSNQALVDSMAKLASRTDARFSKAIGFGLTLMGAVVSLLISTIVGLAT